MPSAAARKDLSGQSTLHALAAGAVGGGLQSFNTAAR